MHLPLKFAFAFLLCVSTASAQYFPVGAFDPTAQNDQFKRDWYVPQLEALKEPSLFELSKTSHSESYRFTWLRTFNNPVAIRLEVHADGTGELAIKISDGAGGYRPGKLVTDTKKPLSKVEVAGFIAKIDQLDFWHAPNPIKENLGDDGSQWIIEGEKNGQYHVIDRWTPASGIARELGDMLAFDLAHLNIPKREIY